MQNKARQDKQKILVFGTFDGLHEGHLFFLKEAQKLGRLFVSVASDESVALHKNKTVQRAVSTRKKELETLKIAHEVIVGDKKPGNWSAIKKINPDIVAAGYDQTGLYKALKHIQKEFNFKIKKIKSFMPQKYHSSILNKQKSCAYCTVPEIKERTIVENELAWAFPTNIPIVPGHVLIVPKRCVAKYEELTKKEVEAIFDLLKRLKESLKKTFKATGFNMAWNEGEIAGQTVPHFHLHILPRKESDTGILKYEPRKFIYRPGSRESTPEKELRNVAKLINKNLK